MYSFSFFKAQSLFMKTEVTRVSALSNGQFFTAVILEGNLLIAAYNNNQRKAYKF